MYYLQKIPEAKYYFGNSDYLIIFMIAGRDN